MKMRSGYQIARTDREKRDAAKLVLLKTLDKPKYLHMGRCPIDAIDLAFEMSHQGLIRIEENWIRRTPRGEKFIWHHEHAPGGN
jgi:hypothetical protein